VDGSSHWLAPPATLLTMASQKVTITLDPAIVAEVRQIAGDVDLSVFVHDVLQWQLQNVRLRGYLDLLEEQFGRVPEELREEARREWDAMKASWKEEL
jgi:hypothetical protein